MLKKRRSLRVNVRCCLDHELYAAFVLFQGPRVRGLLALSMLHARGVFQWQPGFRYFRRHDCVFVFAASIELYDSTAAAAIIRATGIIIVALILTPQPNKQQYPEPCPLAGSL